MSLLEFVAADEGERRAAARAASRGLGEDAGAYRFGEFVFTDPRRRSSTVIVDDRSNAAVWVFFAWPETGTPAPGSKVVVGRRDGSVEQIAVEDFAAAVAEQNRVRAGRNLPALTIPVDPAAAGGEPDAAPEAVPGSPDGGG